MQALTPPEPLEPQRRQGVVDAASGHKAHIVQLDGALGRATA
jgi:hypothetical protein